MVKKIELTHKKVSIVDDEDYEWLNKDVWFAKRSKRKKGEDKWYAQKSVKGTWGKHSKKTMHRTLMEKILEEEGNFELLKKFKEDPSKYPIDHVDGDGLKNTRQNLRIVTIRQNNQNRHDKLTSKYSGVALYTKTGKWRSMIAINGKQKHLGYFDTEKEARAAYVAACVILEEILTS